MEVNEKGISKYLAPVFEELAELSKEDLIKRIVSLEFNRFLDYYRNSGDLNVDIAHPGRNQSDRYHSRGPRMFISLGSVDGLDKGAMLGYVLDTTGLNKSTVGRIEIKPVYSFIELENDQALEAALQAFQGEVFRGRNVRVDRADGPAPKKRDKTPHGGGGRFKNKDNYSGGRQDGGKRDAGKRDGGKRYAGKQESAGGKRKDFNNKGKKDRRRY